MKLQLSTTKVILGLVLLSLSGTLFAQSKVKGLPEALKRPVDHFDNPEFVTKYLYENTGDKSKNDAWVVYSDRNDNPVYESNDPSSAEVSKLAFRDLCFVVDEEDNWIQIAKASGVNKLKSDDIETIGWVEKSKMLLWSSGLVGDKTGINRKAFLLNRAEDVKNIVELMQQDKHLEANFYSDPYGKTTEGDRKIYDHYFVFKRENNMYLLAEDAEIGAFNVQTKLLGWVDSRRIQQWNTRVSIEPNYSEEAYDERKKSKWNQFRAFDSPQSVADYYDQIAQAGVIWDNDPITFAPHEMADGDPRRFKGNVIRFPLFNQSQYGESEHFRSGVIGGIRIGNNDDGSLKFDTSIPEQEYAQIKAKLNEMTFKAETVNIFFVVEGTDETLAYQESIAQAITTLSENDQIKECETVKFGALIYRDIPEGDRIVEYKRLTGDLLEVVEFVRSADFVNKSDQDPYSAMYYGLKESLKVAGFSKSETNIVVLMGATGDFYADKDRRAAARENMHEALVDKNTIFQNLSDLNAHLYGIQLSNAGRPGKAFSLQSHAFILETAKYQYNKSAKNPDVNKMMEQNDDLTLVEPSMSSPLGQTAVVLKGSKPGQLVLPAVDKSLSDANISSGLNEMISSTISFEKLVVEVFNSVYGLGEELNISKISEEGGISAADLSSEVLKIYEEIFASAGVESDYVVQSAEMKLMLYTEVYLPLKSKDAVNSMHSYVLFMPESDLRHYQNLISRNIMSADKGSYAEKREALYEMYLALIGQFASQDYLKNKKPEDMTRKEVMEIMQGIEGEGLNLQVELNVTVGDIVNEKAVKNEEIDQLIQRFVTISQELEGTLRMNENFPFCYSSDNLNRYYWLKLSEVF